MSIEKIEDFVVECNVCKARLKNHFGSTPCCGSIAWMVDEQGNATKDFVLLGSAGPGPIQPLLIKAT